MFLGNSQHGPQVQRKTPYTLLENLTQKLAFERKWTHESSTQAIESVVAAIIVLFQPLRKPFNRLEIVVFEARFEPVVERRSLTDSVVIGILTPYYVTSKTFGPCICPSQLKSTPALFM